jgi:hypothetical protein
VAAEKASGFLAQELVDPRIMSNLDETKIGRCLRKYYEPANDLPPCLFLLVRKVDEGFEISARDSSAARASIDVGSRFVRSSFDRGDRGCEFSLPFRVLNRTSPLVRRGASQPLAPRLRFL